ncbi:hypothetical protein JB92DRAFT_820916 [Gautieria morchelliformis]|nr:hypothetical protein JB92DRAFT_820916 [Gautieria morchelliformis]
MGTPPVLEYRFYPCLKSRPESRFGIAEPASWGSSSCLSGGLTQAFICFRASAPSLARLLCTVTFAQLVPSFSVIFVSLATSFDSWLIMDDPPYHTKTPLTRDPVIQRRKTMSTRGPSLPPLLCNASALSTVDAPERSTPPMLPSNSTEYSPTTSEATQHSGATSKCAPNLTSSEPPPPFAVEHQSVVNPLPVSNLLPTTEPNSRTSSEQLPLFEIKHRSAENPHPATAHWSTVELDARVTPKPKPERAGKGNSCRTPRKKGAQSRTPTASSRLENLREDIRTLTHQIQLREARNDLTKLSSLGVSGSVIPFTPVPTWPKRSPLKRTISATSKQPGMTSSPRLTVPTSPTAYGSTYLSIASSTSIASSPGITASNLSKRLQSPSATLTSPSSQEEGLELLPNPSNLTETGQSPSLPPNKPSCTSTPTELKNSRSTNNTLSDSLRPSDIQLCTKESSTWTKRSKYGSPKITASLGMHTVRITATAV